MLLINLNHRPEREAPPNHRLGLAVLSLALVLTALFVGTGVWVFRNDFVNVARKVTVRPMSGEERELVVAHLDRLSKELPRYSQQIEKVRSALYAEKTLFLISPSYLQHQVIEKRGGRWILSESFFGADTHAQELAVLRALGIRSETVLRPHSGPQTH